MCKSRFKGHACLLKMIIFPSEIWTPTHMIKLCNKCPCKHAAWVFTFVWQSRNAILTAGRNILYPDINWDKQSSFIVCAKLKIVIGKHFNFKYCFKCSCNLCRLKVVIRIPIPSIKAMPMSLDLDLNHSSLTPWWWSTCSSSISDDPSSNPSDVCSFVCLKGDEEAMS